MSVRRLVLRTVFSILSFAWTSARASRRGSAVYGGSSFRKRFMSDTAENRSTLGLISDALSQASKLFGAEIKLAQTDIGEKIGAAVMAIVSIVVAAVFLVVALIFLLQALIAWLVELGWRLSISSLAVGVGIAVIATVAGLVAKSRLSLWKLAPMRSIDQAGKTVEVLRGKHHS